jgi:hypothetical protein
MLYIIKAKGVLMTKKVPKPVLPPATVSTPVCESSYPMRVQVIRAKGKKTGYYVYLPLALVAALGITGGEEVSWELLARDELHLVRLSAPPPKAKKRK